MRAFLYPLLLALSACAPQWLTSDGAATDSRELIVLYTNDEHGWMQGQEAGKGAAALLRYWRENEAYRERGPFLILSGGDNWTGPAISTWTQGEAMVEVMNTMGYDAAAVGNHEFDFGLEVLRQRSSEADYPYLSANTRWREGGGPLTDQGIEPYTIAEVNGLTVGIIGLTTTSTPTTTLPSNVRALQFDDYEASLRQWVPALRGRDIDLLFVIAHVCVPALETLIRQVADLEIDLFGAGHCNELVARQLGETILLGGGSAFRSYARATLSFNETAQQVVSVSLATQENIGSAGDAALSRIIDHWQSRVEALTAEIIGHNETALERTDPRLQQAIIDSWLLADPSADIAIINAGGIRAPLPAGDITLGAVVAVMPFDNTIVAVQVPGSAVRQALAEGRTPVVAGLHREGEQWLLNTSGRPLEDSVNYRVLVNNFMYEGGDGYGAFREADPNAFDMGINYRQPFLQWLQSGARGK